MVMVTGSELYWPEVFFFCFLSPSEPENLFQSDPKAEVLSNNYFLLSLNSIINKHVFFFSMLEVESADICVQKHGVKVKSWQKKKGGTDTWKHQLIIKY